MEINTLNEQSLNIIVIDNFYKEPYIVRKYALLQDFNSYGNWPGVRTHRQFNNFTILKNIEKYIKNYGYEIIENYSNYENNLIGSGNCSFTLSTTNDIAKTWIHRDVDNEDEECKCSVYLSGIIYLTPEPPINGGTLMYEFDYNSNYDPNVSHMMYSKDFSKWKRKDIIGNVFNRLVLFNANSYHSVNELFGINKYDGRLTQNIFIKCKKTN